MRRPVLGECVRSARSTRGRLQLLHGGRGLLRVRRLRWLRSGATIRRRPAEELHRPAEDALVHGSTLGVVVGVDALEVAERGLLVLDERGLRDLLLLPSELGQLKKKPFFA